MKRLIVSLMLFVLLAGSIPGMAKPKANRQQNNADATANAPNKKATTQPAKKHRRRHRRHLRWIRRHHRRHRRHRRWHLRHMHWLRHHHKLHKPK
jgi:hypothetical protein